MLIFNAYQVNVIKFRNLNKIYILKYTVLFFIYIYLTFNRLKNVALLGKILVIFCHISGGWLLQALLPRLAVVG